MTKEQKKQLLRMYYNGCSDEDIDKFAKRNGIPEDESFCVIAEQIVPKECKGCGSVLSYPANAPCTQCSRGKQDKYVKRADVDDSEDKQRTLRWRRIAEGSYISYGKRFGIVNKWTKTLGDHWDLYDYSAEENSILCAHTETLKKAKDAAQSIIDKETNNSKTC